MESQDPGVLLGSLQHEPSLNQLNLVRQGAWLGSLHGYLPVGGGGGEPVLKPLQPDLGGRPSSLESLLVAVSQDSSQWPVTGVEGCASPASLVTLV